MKYQVEFNEKAIVERTIQVIVEADSIEDVYKAVECGNYEFIDSWDNDDLNSEFLEIISCEPYEDD